MRGDPCGDALESRHFGFMPNGAVVQLYTLRNRAGMAAGITTYGGIVTSLTAPARDGQYSDIVLGYDTLEGYLQHNPYFGALIGRYANRIAGGRFVLNGTEHRLATNEGSNTLHGGPVGFDKVLWKVIDAEVTSDGPRVRFEHLSHDGENGFPGSLLVRASYTLTWGGALRLEYVATTDQPTVVNFTHHSYFNLRGSGDVLGHQVQINADRFVGVDATLIPTGELRSVRGTAFDFRSLTAIGARIDEIDEQLRFGRGYDHTWVNKAPGGAIVLNARVYEPVTGRVLEVLSDQPGLHFYSGNFLDGSTGDKGGRHCSFRSGFCMEPQHFADSPNHPEFPSTVLNPGRPYTATIIYKFGTQ